MNFVTLKGHPSKFGASGESKYPGFQDLDEVSIADTGKITAQYHVVFNKWFQTINSTGAPTVDFDHVDCFETFGLHPWKYIPRKPGNLFEFKLFDLAMQATICLSPQLASINENMVKVE